MLVPSPHETRGVRRTSEDFRNGGSLEVIVNVRTGGLRGDRGESSPLLTKVVDHSRIPLVPNTSRQGLRDGGCPHSGGRLSDVDHVDKEEG